jgi:hypothetical protein
VKSEIGFSSMMGLGLLDGRPKLFSKFFGFSLGLHYLCRLKKKRREKNCTNPICPDSGEHRSDGSRS